MNASKFKIRFFPLLILLALFFQNSLPVFACGPFTLDPVFSFSKHPDYPLVEYNRGNVGVVPDSFGRISLYVFYRQLNDMPFTAEEQRQIAAAMRMRIGGHWEWENKSKDKSAEAGVETKQDYRKLWQETRAKILGETKEVATDKITDSDYDYVYNCLPDAFKTATQTLEARLAAHGNDENLKQWIAGQDAVFANCSGTADLPKVSASNFPDWLKQDRQYQIAAALFYQDKQGEARDAFEKIAEDNASAWNKTARFVVARTYIREASAIDIESPDYEEPPKTNINSAATNSNTTSNMSMSNTSMTNSNMQFVSNSSNYKIIKSIDDKKRGRDELLQHAATHLRGVLSDASMSEFHSSAQRLLNLVEYRINPIERRRELAKILVNPAENKNIYNDLIDYVWLLDGVESDAAEIGMETDQKEREKSGKTDDDYSYSLKIRDVAQTERAADLSDWLFSYQADDSFAHSYQKWHDTGKNAWLVLALVKADAKNSQTGELIAAADKLSPGSKAYATARYHQIRLLLETGKRAEASQKLNDVLANNFSKFNVSTQNKFFAQKMILAENLNDFLKYAQRHPATFSWSDDANEEGTDIAAPGYFDGQDMSNSRLKLWVGKTMFDEDAVAFFNEKMPLSVLRQAAVSPALPDHLKKFVVVAGWTRAFILKNQAVEREFAPLVLKYAPELQPLFSKYATATGANAQAAALIALLRYPVMQPYVPVGYGRDDSTPTPIDSIRGNWWCVKKIRDDYERDFYDRWDFKHPAVYPDFLTVAQNAESEREQKQLTDSDNSATFLVRRALEFAKANPNHPQIAETLHLAVRSTRYGCKDEETGTFSKQAFDLLHQRYKNSPWTKQTPYWFGLETY